MVNKKIESEIKNEDKECFIEEFFCTKDIVNKNGKLNNIQLARLKLIKEFRPEIIKVFPEFLSLFDKINDTRLKNKNG